MPYTSDSWTFGHVPTTFKRLPTVNRWGVLHGFYSDQRDDQELSNSAPDMPSGVGFRILANRNIWRFPNIEGALTWIQATNTQATQNGALFWRTNSNVQSQSKTLTTSDNKADIGFSAQRHNPIYDSSNTTVKVDSLCGLALIRAYQWQTE